MSDAGAVSRSWSDRAERLLGPLAGVLSGSALCAMAVLTTADVVGRKFLSRPIAGALEVTELLVGVAIFAALPLVSCRGEHICFDALSDVLSSRLRQWQWRLSNLLAAGAWGGLASLLALKASELRAFGDFTPEFRFPVWAFAAFASTLTIMAALAHLRVAANGAATSQTEIL